VEIPSALYRRLTRIAASEHVAVEDLVARLLRRGLDSPQPPRERSLRASYLAAAVLAAGATVTCSGQLGPGIVVPDEDVTIH
jgi:hypothetical protein